jgi:glucosamine-6-phosphate deaminase
MLKIIRASNPDDLGKCAAKLAARILLEQISLKGSARMVMATGASQFSVLDALRQYPDIDWSRVTVFHLDEYANLPETHPASFRKYLKDRFINKLPIKIFHEIRGDSTNLDDECKRLNNFIYEAPIDLGLIGIGENGHIAFNDPPADFVAEDPYIVVNLDVKCRQQQVGEGWFNNFDDVPSRAISMSVRQIMKCKTLVCSVPDLRKAQAVMEAVQGPITPMVPASILQNHQSCHLILDLASSSLLKPETLTKYV